MKTKINVVKLKWVCSKCVLSVFVCICSFFYSVCVPLILNQVQLTFCINLNLYVHITVFCLFDNLTIFIVYCRRCILIRAAFNFFFYLLQNKCCTTYRIFSKTSFLFLI